MKKIKKILFEDFSLIMLLFLLFIYFIFDLDINILFGLILIEFVLVCIKCKLSFFLIKSLCVNYIVLPLYYQYNFNMSYGILEFTSMSILYEVILFSIFVYNFIWLLFFFKTKILETENKKLRNSNYSINDFFVILLCIISILSVIIAFPRMPFVKVDSIAERFAALLPGNAWNHITIIAMILIFPALKKSNFVKLTYLFNIFWFISHYERVDVIGLVFGLMIVYFVKNNKKINFIKMMKFIIPILIVVVAMTITGDIRNNKDFNFSFAYITNKLLVQSTSADEAYIYNLAIKYRESNGNLYIMPYLSFVYNAVPLLNYNNDVTSILKNTYVGHPGGEYILSVPYMSYGILGVLIFSVLEFIILKFIIYSKSLISYIWYLFILCTSFRIVWYGISYIEMGFIYVIPLILLLSKFFKHGIKYNFKEGVESEV